ncbi:MAG TPA: polysaccharide biosynthesis protein, partial [Dongiaceae bacterium]|nr:polysaccharide biosynthesis protein [Dongiaceae bacterium]
VRFICVRYGNVLASRGSVVPLFHHQIRAGGPVTITTEEMTRFLLSLEQAVDTVLAAVDTAERGETYVPRLRGARVVDLARALIGDRKIAVKVTGIRPGEKVHEIMVSEEEIYRTVERGAYYAIRSILPEVCKGAPPAPALTREFTSADDLMTYEETVDLLVRQRLRIEDVSGEDELLR